MGQNEPAVPAPRSERLESIDLLRGLVMVIMALDHVRDFFSNRIMDDPTDLKTTTAAIFLTRWITHYCAPTFIFLAGTGAFLSGTRGKSKQDLSWFLFTRGLWLVFIELTIVRASWWFNWSIWDHGPGVFWAIGWSMVVLSALVFLPVSAVTTFGVVMIAFHNLLDGRTASQLRMPEIIWIVLHSPGGAPVAPELLPELRLGTGYCLIPWMGVMAAGYGLGSMFLLERGSRRRELLGLGAMLTIAFIVLRYANVYGDPRPWSDQPREGFTILSFLNCTKYPASLSYLLMTLGPAIFLLGVFDRPLGAWAKPIITFGRVPLFYYLLHIPLIHGGVVLLDYLRYGQSPQAFNGPWAVTPKTAEELPGYGVDLWVVYLTWIAVVVILYFPCRWFAEYKRRHRDWTWLSYL
jgi:uncharacterized membrane protein